MEKKSCGIISEGWPSIRMKSLKKIKNQKTEIQKQVDEYEAGFDFDDECNCIDCNPSACRKIDNTTKEERLATFFIVAVSKIVSMSDDVAQNLWFNKTLHYEASQANMMDDIKFIINNIDDDLVKKVIFLDWIK